MGAILRFISGVIVTLVFAAGVLCVGAAVAAQGGRWSERLDVLAHFAPVWLIGAVLVALYGFGYAPEGSKRLLLALGGAGVVASAALIAPEFLRPAAPRASPDAPHQIKLIQLNAFFRNVDAEGTAAWIARENADFVLVEEVRAPIRHALVARGYHFNHGMAHTAIFSRAEAIASPFIVPEEEWTKLPPFARATFAGPDGPFSVIATHLTWPTDPDQKPESEHLARLLDRYDKTRLIFGGDFNLTPWSFTLRRLDHRVGMARRDRAIPSWPARAFGSAPFSPAAPILPIDHVYAGSAWRTVSIRRGPRLGSDHYPLVAVLAWEPHPSGQ